MVAVHALVTACRDVKCCHGVCMGQDTLAACSVFKLLFTMRVGQVLDFGLQQVAIGACSKVAMGLRALDRYIMTV